MDKEYIIIEEKEIAVKIQNSKVNAVRLKNITKKGMRIIQNGCIGIGGGIGEISLEQLEKDAIENLRIEIPYPYELSHNYIEKRDYSKEELNTEMLLKRTEDILNVLTEEFSEFDYSETVLSKEICWEHKNNLGLDLCYIDSVYMIGLILKEKCSANLFDGFISCYGRTFDRKRFFEANRMMLKAYKNKLEVPVGKQIPVFIFENAELIEFLMDQLNGERYGNGSSIFTNKLEEKLFHEKVNIQLNRDPQYRVAAFFDMEGTITKQNKKSLIEEGKLVAFLTDKKTAVDYSLEHTGAAEGEYDDLPQLGKSPLRFEVDSRNLPQVLEGKKAILVYVSSGGDFTPDGNFAAPVQIAFLFDGNTILGKLPEFTMKSNLYKMLGEDYIGTFENDFFYQGDMGAQIQGYYMEVEKF